VCTLSGGGRVRGIECEMLLGLLDLGDLLLVIALFFATMIVIFEFAERRRESRREQLLLDAIEREYEQYFEIRHV
jgi:hypothetical protein